VYNNPNYERYLEAQADARAALDEWNAKTLEAYQVVTDLIVAKADKAIIAKASEEAKKISSRYQGKFIEARYIAEQAAKRV
jgi:triphosphoribosyl-dephospho-CoA synthetase